MKHSPELWTSFYYGAHDALIDYCVASGGFSEKADADRAVACVNACEGIPTEVVVEMGEAMALTWYKSLLRKENCRLKPIARKTHGP